MKPDLEPRQGAGIGGRNGGPGRIIRRPSLSLLDINSLSKASQCESGRIFYYENDERPHVDKFAVYVSHKLNPGFPWEEIIYFGRRNCCYFDRMTKIIIIIIIMNFYSPVSNTKCHSIGHKMRIARIKIRVDSQGRWEGA